MRDGGPGPRDHAVALTLAALLVLAGAFAGEVIAEATSRLMLRSMADGLVASDAYEPPVARLLWTRFLLSAVGLALGALAGGRLAARRLLRAGAFPEPRLYLVAALPVAVLSLLGTATQVAAGEDGGVIAFGLILDAAGVASALVGCWWACRRWEAAMRSL